MKIIKLLIITLFLLFPLGQLTQIPLNIPQVKIYLSDIFVGLLVISWVGEKIINKRKINLPPQSFLLSAFIFAATLSLLLSLPRWESRELIIAGLYLLRFVAYASLYFIFFDLTKRKIKFLNIEISKFLSFSLILSGFFLAVFGLIQYIVFPDIRPLTQYHWDPHYFRVVSTFLDPTFTGLILGLALILLISQLLLKKWRPTKTLIIIGVIIYLALSLTYSRSSYFAYIIGVSLLCFFKRQPKLFFSLFLVGILTILILPRPAGEGVRLERESTILAKIENYKNTLTIIKDNPLLGVGFNNYRFTQKDYGFLKEDWEYTHAGAGSDSSLLFTLATTGIFGFSIFILWLAKTLLFALKQKENLLVATMLAIFVHSLFANSFFYPWVMFWLFIILGANLKRFKDNRKKTD